MVRAFHWKVDIFPPDARHLLPARASQQRSLQIGAMTGFCIWRTVANHAGNCSRCKQSSLADLLRQFVASPCG
jgi:hypothetical protein